ncbi:MAG: peroxiredoxin family protein [Phycisphaerae bacterium]
MHVKRIYSAALIVVLLNLPALADKGIDKLIESYQEAEAKWVDSNEASDSFDWKTHPVKDFMPRFRKIAEADKGKPPAFEALVWMLMNVQPVRQIDGDKAADTLSAWAMERLKGDHASDVTFLDLSTRLQFLAYEIDLDLLVPYYEAVIQESKDREKRAFATYNLAAALYSPFSRRGMLPDPKRLKADRERGKTLFYKIIKDHDGTKAAEAARPFIFEIEHLQIGQKAPDIVGKLPDGKEVRLSQYRGQVVLLDFWGFW